MKFPSYVPEPVKGYISNYLLDNKKDRFKGWIAVIDEYKEELSSLAGRIEHFKKFNTDYHKELIAKLRVDYKEKEEGIKFFTENVACLRGLVEDKRMEGVYKLLKSESLSDRDWELYIRAAWTSLAEYSAHRNQNRNAVDVAKEIAKTAGKLAGLLEKFPYLHIEMPSEFHHIPTLIEKTDHKVSDFDYHIWRAVKRNVLGDFTRELSNETKQQISDTKNLRVEFVLSVPKLPLSEADSIISSIRYAWEKSPPVSCLLNTIKEVAEKFRPRYISKTVKAATSSRKSNAKTEYIRAFGAVLIDDNFKITSKVMKGMAMTANVVINSPDIDTSYDDVRKAIKSLEDSA